MENRTTITVALYGADAAFDQRRRFRDAVQTALEQGQCGGYVGGGSMVTDEPNYNVEFEIEDDGQALTLVRDTLRQAGVGVSAEIFMGPDRRYNVYDDNWTDLGPRPATPRPKPAASAGTTISPASSPEEFLALMKQKAAEAVKKYRESKDPNSGG